MIGKAALIAGQGIGPGQIIPDEYTVGALRGLLVKRLVDHVRFDIFGDPARPTGPGLVLSDICQALGVLPIEPALDRGTGDPHLRGSIGRAEHGTRREAIP